MRSTRSIPEATSEPASNLHGVQQRSLALPALSWAGAVAGLVGAVLIDAFLISAVVFVHHDVTLVRFYQYVASGGIGARAYSADGYAWLGLALHAAIGVAWGLGYAYVAQRTPQVRERPLISGLAFGFVVYFAMQLVTVAAAIYVPPTPSSLGLALLAHLVFFGLPIAYTLRALERPA